MPATATERRPPSVANVVANLDPAWTPPEAAPLAREVQPPKPVRVATVTDAEVLNAIREGVFVVDLANGDVTARGKKLKPFSNRTDTRRFVRLHLHGRRRGMAVSRLVWMAATRTLIPDGFEIHHDDHDAGNDAWENLICLHAMDHRKKHGQAAADEEVPF